MQTIIPTKKLLSVLVGIAIDGSNYPGGDGDTRDLVLRDLADLLGIYDEFNEALKRRRSNDNGCKFMYRVRNIMHLRIYGVRLYVSTTRQADRTRTR